MTISFNYQQISAKTRACLQAVLTLYVCAGAAIASADTASMQVVTYAGTGTAQAMAAHDYSRVIRLSSTDAARLGFGDLTNICAAHLLRGDPTAAVRACGVAIAYRSSPSVLGTSPSRRERWAAYANRAVARALTGDRDGALDDLSMAMRLTGGHAVLAHNLGALNALDASRVALLEN